MKYIKYFFVGSLVLLVGYLSLFGRPPQIFNSHTVAAEEISADTDMPLVVRFPGGMLEAASILGSRSFIGATDPTVLGQELPFCRERSSWIARYKITYRLRLSEKWPMRFQNGTLFIRVPELEPNLPVAIDTASLVQSGREKCFLMLELGTRERVLRRISADLKIRAESFAAKEMARQSARKTVSEFVRVWAFNQSDHPEVPPDAKIKVLFPGE